MKASILIPLIFAFSNFASASGDKVYTDPVDLYSLLKANPQIQAVPVAAQLAFGKPVLVTSVTLIETAKGCFQRAKVNFIQPGQGKQANGGSSEEFGLKDCATDIE